MLDYTFSLIYQTNVTRYQLVTLDIDDSSKYIIWESPALNMFMLKYCRGIVVFICTITLWSLFLGGCKINIQLISKKYVVWMKFCYVNCDVFQHPRGCRTSSGDPMTFTVPVWWTSTSWGWWTKWLKRWTTPSPKR